MAAEDYFYDEDYDNDYSDLIECKFCGNGNLTWENDNGKCRLIDHRGIVHKCKPKPIDVDKLMDTKL